MKTIFLLAPILIILFVQNTSAKMPVRRGVPTILPWEIGFSGGASIFLTSVNTDPNAVNQRINYWKSGINPGFGLFVVRNISPSLGIEVNWLNTQLTGKWDDKWPPPLISPGHESPLTFKSQINQFDLMVVFNVDQIMLPGDEEDYGHIFIKTGMGLSQIKDTKEFYPDSHNYNRLSFALSLGYSHSLKENIKLQLGSTFRSVNTDNLDGIHVVSTDKDGNIVQYMKIFEIYNYTYISVSYSIGDFGAKKHKNTYHRRR